MPSQYQGWTVNHDQLALLEFASVQQECPLGVYVSPTPGAPSIWQGVYFVRRGTYANSVLRFHVVIPPEFPERAPSLIFDSEVFHPLVASQTQTFSNAETPRKPQKAGDALRLPTGGMNLGHGFPEWFRAGDSGGAGDMPTTTEQRVRQAMAESPSPAQLLFSDHNSSGDDDEYGQDDTPSKPGRRSQHHTNEPGGLSGMSNGAKKLMFMPPPAADALEYGSTRSYSGIRAVLEYMVQAFEDDEFLDGIGFDDAANEGALKAWVAYRIQYREVEELKRLRKLEKEKEARKGRDAGSDGISSGTATPRSNRNSMIPGSAASLKTGFNSSLAKSQTPRSPQQWDWNGVWLERVRKLVKDSNSEARLYKSGSGGVPGQRDDGTIDMIRFLDLEKEDIKEVKAALKFSQRNQSKSALPVSDVIAKDWASAMNV